MAATVHVAWAADLLGYDFGPGHPMAPLRLHLTIELARALGVLDADGVVVADAGIAPDSLLETVHIREYVAAVHAASGGVRDLHRGLGTQDDPLFAGMHDAAARIVAGTCAAARAVWRGDALHGVSVAGGMHHAMPDAASGFCVYNDAAVAIRALLDDGVERVAYVDLDAHHGDGVQKVFWDDPRVLTISVHESPATLFPHTGYPTETGGPGAPGSAVNVALPARTGPAGWLRAIDGVVPEVLMDFRPQVLVTQHGCDAHAHDPLSSLRVSTAAQRAAVRRMHALAHQLCDGRWVALGGGGYAVVDVVPRVWASLLAEAAHVPVPAHTPLPEEWCELVRREVGAEPPAVIDEDGDEQHADPSWSGRYDPADGVDRAVMATRSAVFPLLGLHPEAY